MSPEAWLFSAAFAVTFGVAVYHLTSNDRTAAVWWGFGCWTVVGLGFGYFYLQSPAAPVEDPARLALEKLTAQNEQQLRPYIDALNPMLSPLVVGRAPVVRVTIKNTGKTPAVDVMVGSRVQVGDFPLFTDTKYEAIDAPRATLGAGQSATVDIPSDHPLTEDELAGLKSGMKWLKAHGEIVFTADPKPNTPFNHPHFCFVLRQLGNAMEVCDNFGDHTDQGVFR